MFAWSPSGNTAMMARLLGKYQNGNYTVRIYADGTKVRETPDDEFVAEFPESMDVKITNRCEMGCPWCHENSLPDGKHGDVHVAFIDTLKPYTEIALGGGNPLAHPELETLLRRLKDHKVIANMTVSQYHFETQQERIKRLADTGLVNGLGVSLSNATPEFVETVRSYPNAVIHVINGIVPVDELMRLDGCKILILGYKDFRRGHSYYSEEVKFKQTELRLNLPSIMSRFSVISFDNLAIEQLAVRELLSPAQWNEFYMGDDGMFTMFIDLVEGKFARNSTSEERFELRDSVDEMFRVVKEVSM